MAMAIVQGMSTLARDGATRNDLLEIVAATMTVWPSEKESTF
jgi:hypothetical protein